MTDVIELDALPMTVITVEQETSIISIAAQGPTGITGATGANGQGVATGGTTGQILAKTSNTDFATAWQDLSGQNILSAISNTNNRLLVRQAGGWTPIVSQDSGVQALASTITWTGTAAPSGATNHFYWWTQLDKMVQVWLVLNYATASTATTQVQVAWPSDLPTPYEWTGLTAALSLQYSGFASFASSPTASGGSGRAYIRRNSAGTSNECVAIAASSGYRTIHMNFIYRAA